MGTRYSGEHYWDLSTTYQLWYRCLQLLQGTVSHSSFTVQCFRTHIQIIRTHLCGYDLNLTYPQNGTFPTLRDPFIDPGNLGKYRVGSQSYTSKLKSLIASAPTPEFALNIRNNLAKRDLSGRANGTIDPWYVCGLLEELLDYAANFTKPWCESTSWNWRCTDSIFLLLSSGE